MGYVRGFAPDPTGACGPCDPAQGTLPGRCPWTPRGVAPLDPATLHGGPCKVLVEIASYARQQVQRSPRSRAPRAHSPQGTCRASSRDKLRGRGAPPLAGFRGRAPGGVAGAAGPRRVRGEAPSSAMGWGRGSGSALDPLGGFRNGRNELVSQHEPGGQHQRPRRRRVAADARHSRGERADTDEPEAAARHRPRGLRRRVERPRAADHDLGHRF